MLRIPKNVIFIEKLSCNNEKRLYFLDVYTILNRIQLTYVGHMRISGTEPSSVTLIQTK